MQSLGPAAKTKERERRKKNPPDFCRALIESAAGGSFLTSSTESRVVALCSFVIELIPHSTAFSELSCCLFYFFGTGFQTRHCDLNEITWNEHPHFLFGFSVEMQTLQHLSVP